MPKKVKKYTPMGKPAWTDDKPTTRTAEDILRLFAHRLIKPGEKALTLDEASYQLAEALIASMPGERVLPPINSEWNEAWMWQEGGASSYNQARDQAIAAINKFFGVKQWVKSKS